jgi:hypothetical protein
VGREPERPRPREGCRTASLELLPHVRPAARFRPTAAEGLALDLATERAWRAERLALHRFVRIWKTCRSASVITSNTSAMNPSGTCSWNRSLIELTKIRRGRLQRSGCPSLSGCSTTFSAAWAGSHGFRDDLKRRERRSAVFRADDCYIPQPLTSNREGRRQGSTQSLAEAHSHVTKM